MTTTVIDIQARVSDETGSGTSSVIRNLTKIEQSAQSMQKTLANAQNMTKLELTASLKDSASAGLSGIMSLGKSLKGSVWSVTSKLIDYATSPIKAILNLVKNPIVQTVTLMGITAGVTDTISTYASYEQTMADTKAVTGASDAEMSAISTVAKELGATTTFSAAEVGAGASVLGTAGWGADQITSGLGGIVTMAQAGSVDIATAADINTSTIAQYGLQSSDSGYVGDVLASTAANSKTDISGLGETFKYVGSTASALEFSLEDTAIAVGLLGNAAIDGSQAGTSLRTLFTNLVDPTNDTATAMDKLGVSLTNDQGEMNSLMDIMLQLRTGFSTLSAEEQAFYASSLAGTEGLSGLLAIANAGEEDFDKLTASIYGAEGAAQAMADTRVDSLSGDFPALSSAVDGVKISIGERLAPTLRSFVQMATDYVPRIGEAIDSALGVSQMRFSMLIETPEWESAGLSEKITLTWNAMVGDPFMEWWNNGGQESAMALASNAGNTLGSVLSGGLMTLLGVDIGESASVGMQVGKAFVDGFTDGFDFDGITEGLLNAFKSVAGEAGKIFTGDATGSSWLAAGAMAYGGVKVASGLKTAVDVGKGIYDTGSAVVGAGKALSTASSSTGLGSMALSTAGKMAQSAGVVSLVFDGLLGSSKSEEWLGGNSIGENIVSAISGALGGSNSGFGGALTGAAKGAAVGSLFGGPIGTGVGAVVGGVSGAIGGEQIAQGIDTYMTTIGEACSTFGGRFSEIWKKSMEEISQTNDSRTTETKSIFNEVSTNYFGNLSEAWTTFWSETGTTWSEKKTEASTWLGETTTTYFGNLSGAWTLFWDETDNFWLSKKDEASTWLSSTTTEYFSNLDRAWTTFWDNAFGFFTNSVPNALESVSGSISGFFSNLKGGVSDFCSNALASAGNWISTGFNTITGGAFSKYAEGGILSTPHLGLVAEDGPEAIIPLGGKRRSRGIALWEEAGRQLGVTAYADGGIIGRGERIPTIVGASGSSVATTEVHITMGPTNFQVTVPDGEKSDVVSAIRENISELTEEIALELSKTIKRSFSNMPILG
ncbi:MAG: phage tail tape measure protein [Eubacteriales bacterium]